MIPKTVLIVGPKGQLAKAIHLNFTAAAVTVLANELDSEQWLDSSQVDAFFADQSPSLVLYTRALDASGDQAHHSKETQRLQNALNAAAKSEAIFVFLSSYRVFGGENKNRYDFNDAPAPKTPFGRSLVQMENQVRELEQHVILRFSWLLDPNGDNLFTRILSKLHDGEALELNKSYKGAPSWQSDAIWSLRGVVQQLLAGAKNWGVFHYCSEDHCSEWQLATHIRELLEMEETNFTEIEGEGHSAVLSCRRLRNNFGVHPRSWREGLKQRIVEWKQDR